MLCPILALACSQNEHVVVDPGECKRRAARSWGTRGRRTADAKGAYQKFLELQLTHRIALSVRRRLEALP